MEVSDFARELELPIPLFSKGLYFLQRGNRDMLQSIVHQTEQLLQYCNPTQMPILYLHSIEYVLYECAKLNIETDLCNLLLKNSEAFSADSDSSKMNSEDFWIDFIFPNSEHIFSSRESMHTISSDDIVKTVNYDKLSIYKGLAGLGLYSMLII